MSAAQPLPLWLDVTVSALVLLGAFIAFMGSFGLLRLKTYFERVHAPSIIATLATWCVMHATLIYFSAIDALALHAGHPVTSVRDASDTMTLQFHDGQADVRLLSSRTEDQEDEHKE